MIYRQFISLIVLLSLGSTSYAASTVRSHQMGFICQGGSSYEQNGRFHCRLDIQNAPISVFLSRWPDSDGTSVATYSYDAWGRMRDPQTLIQYASGSQPSLLLGRGYCGHEHLSYFGLINMNARLYDPVLGRFLSPDTYVQSPDFSQNFNRYAYALNNPLKYTDPTGNIISPLLVSIAAGTVFGGISGYTIWLSNGANHDQLAKYIFEGAAIGGISTLLTGGLGYLGCSSWMAGAIGGAISGAGFGWLSSDGDVSAILNDTWKRAVSGLSGGLVGSAIGGGLGAGIGGGIASGLNTYLNGENDWKQIGLSALMGGGLTYGNYELMSYIQYKNANLRINDYKVTYGQYKTMQADYQRSRFYHKEYGGILTKDGKVVRAPNKYRAEYHVLFESGWTGDVPSESIVTHYHTHWNANDVFLGYSSSAEKVYTANGPSSTDMDFIKQTSSLAPTAFLIDRTNLYIYDYGGIVNSWRFLILGSFPFFYF